MTTIIYSPEPALRRPSKFLSEIFRSLYRSHHLGLRLALRDMRAQYRQSFLGVLWALILPLGNTGAWLLMRGAGIVNVGETAVPYALYVFSGTMLWGIFVEALSAPMSQAEGAKQIIARVAFPPEALVISGLYQTMLSASIKLILIVSAFYFAGEAPTISAALLPVGAASLILAGTAIGVLLTPLGLLYTDVGKSIPLLCQFMMYLTPVVYAPPTDGTIGRIVELNPISPLIMMSREWASGVIATSSNSFTIITASFAAILFVVWIIYKIAMPIIVERISS